MSSSALAAVRFTPSTAPAGPACNELVNGSSMDYYGLASGYTNKAVDIKVPVGSGSLLQAIAAKDEANQRWVFEPVSPGSSRYYILNADKSLAIDVRDPAQPGAELLALDMKPGRVEQHQHWIMVPLADVGRGGTDDLPYSDGLFAIKNAHSGLYIQLNPDGGLTVDEPIPFGPEEDALEGASPAPASEGGRQLWTAFCPGTGQPELSPRVDIAGQPVLDPPDQASNGSITVTVRATGFFPGSGLTLLYSYDSKGNQASNFGDAPVYTADFGGNMEASFTEILGGPGRFEITVKSVSELYSASVRASLDAIGQFYNTTND